MTFVMITILSSYNNSEPHNALYINNLPCETAIYFLLLWLCAPTRVMASPFTRFVDHKQSTHRIREESPGVQNAT